MVFRSARNQPATTRPSGSWDSAEPMTASIASAVNFFAGVWLVLAPFIFGFQSTGGAVEGYWNEVVVGICVALLALVRSFAPSKGAWLSAVNVVLGGWLIASPFVLGYEGTDAAAATVVDVATGVVIVLMGTTSLVATVRGRRRADRA